MKKPKGVLRPGRPAHRVARKAAPHRATRLAAAEDAFRMMAQLLHSLRQGVFEIVITVWVIHKAVHGMLV